MDGKQQFLRSRTWLCKKTAILIEWRIRQLSVICWRSEVVCGYTKRSDKLLLLSTIALFLCPLDGWRVEGETSRLVQKDERIRPPYSLCAWTGEATGGNSAVGMQD